MRRMCALLVLAASFGSVPASAQDKKVDVNIGAGYTFSISDVRKYLGDGYNFNTGITFNATPIVGIQVEYGFTGLGAKEVRLPVSAAPAGGASVDTPFFADMNMQYGNLNLVFKPRMDGKVKPYFIAGVGLYYRPVKVTTPGVGYVPGYCNPWWYVCVPGGFVPVTSVVGSRSSTDFGLDFGAGMNIAATDRFDIYLEARYHYIWGPEAKSSTQLPAGTTSASGKANGQFLPITIGIRF